MCIGTCEGNHLLSDCPEVRLPESISSMIPTECFILHALWAAIKNGPAWHATVMECIIGIDFLAHDQIHKLLLEALCHNDESNSCIQKLPRCQPTLPQRKGKHVHQLCLVHRILHTFKK